MARVFGISLPAGTELIYNKTLKLYDIAIACNVGKNRYFLSRRLKANLKKFSKLSGVAEAWGLLTQAEKDAWYSAASAVNVNGYNLYTQDKVYRIMNGLETEITPSTFHQYQVGHINISAPATSCLIQEVHLLHFSLPFSVVVNYKSNLVSQGAGAYARLSIHTLRFFSGQNITESQSINFDLVGGWKQATMDLTPKEGTLGHWHAVLEFFNVRGDIYLDDLFITFNATTQNKDPFFDLFPKYWQQTSVPAGVTVEGIYCPDSEN
jgi:hypothetical protein